MLSVSENGRYLTEDGRPFFWLGDTAWLMLYKLSPEEMRVYMRNRKEKGFNVLQVILWYMAEEESCPGEMPCGSRHAAYDEAFFQKADAAVKMAAEMGLYLALVPAWGQLVKSGRLNEKNAAEYGAFLGRRYRGCENIIWVIGGDVRGDEAPAVFRLLAETLKKYDPQRLMTYHPFGRRSSSEWFHEEKWLDLNMFQSGHRRYDQEHLGEWDDNGEKTVYFGEDNFRYVQQDLARSPAKPTLDAEPSYEEIVQGLHDDREPYWQAADVRRYAWWSVLAGACGFTYGNNSIIQFLREGEKGAYGAFRTWQEALHCPGSAQMHVLKDLMESADFTHGREREDLLLYGQKPGYHRVAVFAGEDYIICYNYTGDAWELNLSEYKNRIMEMYWIDPENGGKSYAGEICGREKLTVRPTRRLRGASDWVLLLKGR